MSERCRSSCGKAIDRDRRCSERAASNPPYGALANDWRTTVVTLDLPADCRSDDRRADDRRQRRGPRCRDTGHVDCGLWAFTARTCLMDDQNLRSWLVREIRDVLDRKTAVPPLLLWLDPDSQWLDLLRAAAQTGGFDLWADPAQHELIVRDRFCRTPRAPRVVWLPCKREDITWFKPFELEAEAVWERTLLEAIREFGIYIPREHEADLACELPAYAREWFDQPKDAWEELTPGNARGALIDDARMLQVLAGETGEFERLRTDGRFDFFANRAVKDLGLPDPTGKAEDLWRLAATARLLATEAAEGCPQDPPRENDKIIPPGLARQRCVGPSEELAEQHPLHPDVRAIGPRSGQDVGVGLLGQKCRQPATIVQFAARGRDAVQLGCRTAGPHGAGRFAHEGIGARTPDVPGPTAGFLGAAGNGSHRLAIPGAAGRRRQPAGGESRVSTANGKRRRMPWLGTPRGVGSWTGPVNSSSRRSRTSRPSCIVFAHGSVAGICEQWIRIGGTFSELLSADSSGVASMPTAGEAVLAELQRQKGPLALVFLDACRFDLGQRLADMLNTGEPAQRATVSAAVAPVPSITDLGMALALPMPRSQAPRSD